MNECTVRVCKSKLFFSLVSLQKQNKYTNYLVETLSPQRNRTQKRYHLKKVKFICVFVKLTSRFFFNGQ